MVRRKLRQLRPQSKSAGKKKANQVTGRVSVVTEVPPVVQAADFKKPDIVSKLIPLSVPSARDARVNAEKATDNVLAAIVHVLGEGDLSIADFGEFRTGKDAKTGHIHISFTPYGKLKQAVEARLNPLS